MSNQKKSILAIAIVVLMGFGTYDVMNQVRIMVSHSSAGLRFQACYVIFRWLTVLALLLIEWSLNQKKNRSTEFYVPSWTCIWTTIVLLTILMIILIAGLVKNGSVDVFWMAVVMWLVSKAPTVDKHVGKNAKTTDFAVDKGNQG